MPDDFESALSDCIDRLRRGGNPDECLGAYPHHAQRLQPLLEAASRVQKLGVPQPSAAALARGERTLLQTITQERARASGGPFWRLFRPLVMLAGAAAVAGIALAALAGAGIIGDLFDTSPTEAQEFHGSLASSSEDSFEMSTSEGAATVVIGEDTTIEDADGSEIRLEIITPGTRVIVLGRSHDHGRIEAIKVRVEPPGHGGPNPGRGEGPDDDLPPAN
ncbi:MAG: hypothetical protein HYS09_05385, partial [Chloroflexi bacterium]|nr:hypothetical protein [Chloroflexota bacterium]